MSCVFRVKRRTGGLLAQNGGARDWEITEAAARAAAEARMRGIEGEQVLVRLIVSESRTHDRQSLVRTIVELLRAEGMAGTTVLKGIAGFGHDRHVHTIDIEVTAQGLPVIIEVVDTQEHVDRMLPQLEALMVGGVIMLERAHVIRYAKGPSATG